MYRRGGAVWRKVESTNADRVWSERAAKEYERAAKERERAAKEAALARVAELEAELERRRS